MVSITCSQSSLRLLVASFVNFGHISCKTDDNPAHVLGCGFSVTVKWLQSYEHLMS